MNTLHLERTFCTLQIHGCVDLKEFSILSFLRQSSVHKATRELSWVKNVQDLCFISYFLCISNRTNKRSRRPFYWTMARWAGDGSPSMTVLVNTGEDGQLWFTERRPGSVNAAFAILVFTHQLTLRETQILKMGLY